jgi:hypothetical protein
MPLKSEEEELNQGRRRRNIFCNKDFGSVMMVSLFDPYPFTVTGFLTLRNSCAD